MGLKAKNIPAATLAKKFSKHTETRDGLLIRVPSSSPSVLTVRFLFPRRNSIFPEHFDLNEELQKTEGESCRVHGHLEVNRVSGSLQISPGKTLVLDGSVVHDIRGMKHMSFDTR